jgi:hypothetical protein
VNAWSAAISGGLLYGLPYAVWLLGGLEPAAAPPDLQPGHWGFVWIQVLALVLLLPALTHDRLFRTVGALILLQAVPWPLLALFVLTGSVPLGLVLSTQAAIALGAITFALHWHLGLRAPEPWRRLARTTLGGLALLGLVYATRMASAGLGS